MFYTTILHPARKGLGLSCNEYCVADIIHRLSGNPSASIRGWCNASRKYIAEEMDLSRQSVITIIQGLVEKGLVEENEDHNTRTTAKWYTAVEQCKESLHHVKKLDTPRKESLQQSVKKLDTDNKSDNKKENIIIIIEGESNEKADELEEKREPVAPPIPENEPLTAVLLTHQTNLKSDKEAIHWGAKSLTLTDEQYGGFVDRFFAKMIADQTERCRIYGNAKDYCYNWIQKRLEFEGNPNDKRTNQIPGNAAPKGGINPAGAKRTAFIAPGSLRRDGA